MKRFALLITAGVSAFVLLRFRHVWPAASATQIPTGQITTSEPVSRNPLERPVLTGVPVSQTELWEKSSTVESMAAFQKWSAEYVANPGPEKIVEGKRIAQTRREAMRGLIEKDPEQALANAVPEAVRRAMPAEVKALLEVKVDAAGNLLVTAAASADGRIPEGKRAVRREAILEDGRRLEAFVYGNREFQPSRGSVPIHGIALDGKLAVSQWPGRVLEPVELADAKKTLTDDPLCPVSQVKVSETGTETAVLTGSSAVKFYCGPGHAQQVLTDAAVAEAIRPPGLGTPIQKPQDAASGGAGQGVPSPLSEGDHAWTTGVKRILVVRVKFEYNYDEDQYYDYTGLTPADCGTIVNDIRSAYLDWSYGRLNVMPVQGGGSKVSSPVYLDRSARDYEGDEIGDIWNEVKSKVQNQSINPDSYDYILVLAGNAPITDEDDDTKTVWWGGLGRVGEGLSFIRMNDATWTNQERIDANVKVSLHEIGHNLGLYHSSNLFTLPQIVDGLPSVFLEYGDRYDRMGSGSIGADFNARYKQWLNWLDNSNVPLAATDGVFTIREHDLEEKSGVRGLQVAVEPVFLPFSGFSPLFVEYRLHNVASDGTNPYVPYNDTLRAYGAQIRLGQFGSPKTFLLDCTPETGNWEPLVGENKDASGNVDSPLMTGRTFFWVRNGSYVYITNIGADPDAGELQVEIQHGPVAGNDPPTGSITTNTPQGAKNQNIIFTASVTDPEDSDLAYHWQIPGFNVDATHPAVFPNSRSITVKFPTIGTWQVKCIASDKHGGEVSLTKTFSVVVNQPPAISAVADQTIDEDESLLNLPFTVSDPTTPAGSLSVTYTNDNASLFSGGSITLGGSGGNRTISLVPGPNRHGTATITLHCSDGVLSDAEQFKITVNPVTPGTSLIGAGAFWRYWDQSAAPSGTWKASGYNDTAWGNNNSRFVYPAPVLNLFGWTVLSTSVTRSTCYFRRTFSMPASPVGTPVMRFLCDDGLVVYNNGVEIWRYNMPDGAVTHTTRADSSIGGDKVNQWITIPLSTAQFTAGGTNTIAVEVHDAGGTRGAGDVTFDFQLQLVQTPTVSVITNKSSQEDAVAGPYSFSATDAESPGGGLTFSATSSNQDLVLDANIKFGFSIITGFNLTATPQPNATGVTEITLKVSDGSSETWRKFNLTITPVNDAPVIAPVPDAAVPMGELAPLVEVQVADVDNDPASLIVTATSSSQSVLPNAGIQVMPGSAPDKRWLRLTPNAGIAAQTVVTVNVSDGAAGSSDAFIFRVSFPLSPTSVDVKLVQSGETWRYWAEALPSTGHGVIDFTDPALDDRAWPSGPSQLGFGNDGEATVVPASPYRVTTYFRKKITVPNASVVSQLKLRMLRDDGAVVYLNGHAVWSSNMPRVTITPTTLAEDDILGSAEDAWQSLTVPTTYLVNGSNTIAVEVHQSVMPAGLNAGDLTFDFEMDGVPAAAANTDVLVAPGEMWSYWDQDTYPDNTWRLATYAEEGWKRGLARLGYGIGGETTTVNKDNTAGTQRNPSVLFRKVFDVADPSVYTALHLFTQRDDGIAVHLNGVRVHFEHVESAATLVDFATAEAPSGEQLAWRHYLIDPKRLIAGRNLLSVEIHQSSAAGTDLNFDLELTGELTGMPTLYLNPSGANMELAWPASYNGWILKGSTDLNTWTTVPEPQLLDAGWTYVLTPAAPVRRFFKLEKP